MTRLDVINFISHGISKEQGRSAAAALTARELEGESDEDEEAPGSGKDPLAAFTVNLNEAAEQGQIDPLIGREKEIERIIQVLVRRRKNNPMLVGDAGVGKTAIAEGLALKIVKGRCRSSSSGAVIYSLDMGVAARGHPLPRRFRKPPEGGACASSRSAPDSILFIDEIHNIMGAGSAGGARWTPPTCSSRRS